MGDKHFFVALAQIRCELLDKEKNLKRMVDAMERAKQKGADYIVFPELFLSGYVMNDSLMDLAESLEGPSLSVLKDTAASMALGVIAGFPEKNGDKLYNAAVYISKDGTIENVYRKTHLFYEERKYFHAGSDCPVIQLPEGRAGMLITYDMEFPEMPRRLAHAGAQVLFVLAANMTPYQKYQDTYLHARAMENHIFTAASNKVGLHVENIFFGESQAVHPAGHSLYKAGHNEELPVIPIDLNDTAAARGRLDYFQHRRPDIYLT
ncbi:carbon-nitrogen hydrolase family protein [Salibacterium sp. K-3]